MTLWTQSNDIIHTILVAIGDGCAMPWWGLHQQVNNDKIK